MSIVAKKIMMGSGAVALPSDDQFNRVSFLSHFDGSNNGVNNAFDDGSDSNHTITANGNVTQGSFGPFARPDGEWGAYFDGDGDYLSFPDSADWDFGTGDFTVEGWVNPASDLASDTQFIGFGDGDDGGNFGFEATGKPYFYHGGYFARTSTALNLGSWSHIAFVRSSGTLSCYINGTSAASSSYTGNVGGTLNPRIGAYSGGQYFKGYMSNVRIVKGTAVYTGNFTPSTSKLTAITNTKLLTCQSNRFVDNSASGHTITPTGNPAISAFGPFLTSKVYKAGTNGASVYMDGASDYLSLSASNDFDVADGDITIECWVYRSAADTTKQCVWEFYTDDNNLLRLFYEGNKKYSLLQRVSGTDNFNVSISGTTSLNEWSHLAVTRSSSGTYKLYINGVENISQAEGVTINTSGIAFYVGVDLYATDRFWNGYISDFRIVKGSLVYSSNNFTPPTAPLTAITNTKLLLNMADGQAIDSAAQNNLTFNGTSSARPKISTSVKKFGDSSFYVPDTTFAISTDGPSFGTGDFTVEMWIYWAGSPGSSSTIYSQITSNSDAGLEGPHLYWEASTQKIIYFANNGSRITSTNAVSNTTWYHLALCRASGSTKMFLDGTQTGSTYSDTINFTGAANIQIGTYRLNGTNVARNNQYYDNLRVSSFARYTSNFTAPAEPFADKGQ